MTYQRHKWQKKDTITSDRLNNIEDGIEEALESAKEPGPQGEPGEKGDTGERGEPGESGIGLIGEAKVIKTLPTNADLFAVVGKLNDLINALKDRGISA